MEEDDIGGDMVLITPLEMSPMRNDALTHAATPDIVTDTNKKYATRSRDNMHEQKRKKTTSHQKFHSGLLAPDTKIKKIDNSNTLVHILVTQ